MRRLRVQSERWPIRSAFVTARGAKTEALLVTVEIEAEGAIGRGECVPYPRYGESVESILAQIENVRPLIEFGLDRQWLQKALPAGAARNALDCALWDLEAKMAGTPVWRLAGLPEPEPVLTAYTISLGDPQDMANAAKAAADYPILKLKIGGGDDPERLAAVRAVRPHARLIADGNEGVAPHDLPMLTFVGAALNVEVLEQPLRVQDDDLLEGLTSAIPLCADESAHTRGDLLTCVGRYAAINVKLDKAGGFTEALAMARTARDLGFKIMLGSMVGTSLGVAPALLLASLADWIDLDGPLLLARDRDTPIAATGALLSPPDPALWG
jgi:L-alanine-DL-glutamate epimerase-like enolase superfamily enzyme